MTFAHRLIKASLPSLLTLAFSLQAAEPRYNFEAPTYYSPYPYGSIQLPQPREHCFNTLRRWGELDGTTSLSYQFAPIPIVYGTPMDLFVGFRLLSQPDKLWLFSKDRQWVEYLPGSLPISYSTRPENLTEDFNGIIYLGHFDDLSGPDLVPLIGDGELLVGYGLRADADATSADAFQEMLDRSRFAPVWRVGEAASPYEICLAYDTLTTTHFSWIAFADPNLKASIPPPAGQPPTPASGFPLGEIQLAKPTQYCLPSLSGTGTLDRVTRLDYTLLPAEIGHLGKSADVFLAYWDWYQPDRLWLLERGSPPVLVEYTPDSTPVALFGDNPIVLAERNTLTLIEAPESAPYDLQTPMKQGSLVIGYGLRDPANGSVAASFQEMLDSKRFGIILRHTTSTVGICFDYSTIRVRDVSVPNSP